MGKTYYLQQKYDDALHELRIATRINPDIAEYWAFLFLVYAHTKNSEAKYERFVMEAIIDFASEVEKEEYKKVLKKAQRASCILDSAGCCPLLTELKEDRIQHASCRSQPPGPRCKRFREIEAFLDLIYFLDTLCEAVKTGETDDLVSKYRYYMEPGNAVNDHQIFALAGLYLDEKLGVDKLIHKLEVYRQQLMPEPLRYSAISLALGKLYLHSGTIDRCQRLIRELVELVGHFNGHDREWEYGQLYCVTAQVCNLLAALEQAAKYYKQAIEVLKGKHSREIRTRDLWLKLGNVLLDQHAFDEAWQIAQDAIKQEPICSDNHKLLGEVYFSKGEFEQAIDAWQDALVRENITMKRPEDPEIYLQIALAYEGKLQQPVEEAQRQSLVSLIQTYCQQVRELDANERYKQQINELLQRLQKPPEEPPVQKRWRLFKVHPKSK